MRDLTPTEKGAIAEVPSSISGSPRLGTVSALALQWPPGIALGL
jgi:hypothetical protein